MKYILLGHMRSGSSVLNESLEMHPDLKIAYEAFHVSASVELTNIPNVKDIIEELYGFRNWEKTDSNLYCRWQKKPDMEIFPKEGNLNIGSYKSLVENVCLNPFLDKVFETYDGFKILYNQLKRNYKIWDYLSSYPELKVIHTYRKNYLDSLISLILANSSGVWQKKNMNSEIKDRPFYLPPLLVEEYFYTLDFEIEHFTSMFRNSLTIEYNQIFDWEKTMKSIQDFLGIKYISMQEKYLKRNTKKAKDLVSNYSELQSMFLNTKWEEHFHLPSKKFLLL